MFDSFMTIVIIEFFKMVNIYENYHERLTVHLTHTPIIFHIDLQLIWCL